MKFGSLSVSLLAAVLARPPLTQPNDDPNQLDLASSGLLRREQASLLDGVDSPEIDEDPSVDADVKTTLMNMQSKVSVSQTARTQGSDVKSNRPGAQIADPSSVTQTVEQSNVGTNQQGASGLADQSGAFDQLASPSGPPDQSASSVVSDQQALPNDQGDPSSSGSWVSETTNSGQDATPQTATDSEQSGASYEQADQNIESNQEDADYNQGDTYSTGYSQSEAQELANQQGDTSSTEYPQSEAQGLEESEGQTDQFPSPQQQQGFGGPPQQQGFRGPPQQQGFGGPPQQGFGGPPQQRFGGPPPGQHPPYGPPPQQQHHHHHGHGPHAHGHGPPVHDHGGYHSVPSDFPFQDHNEPEYETIDWDKMREWPYAGPYGGTGRRRRSSISIAGNPQPYQPVYPQYPYDWTGHGAPPEQGTMDQDMREMMNYWAAPPSRPADRR